MALDDRFEVRAETGEARPEVVIVPDGDLGDRRRVLRFTGLDPADTYALFWHAPRAEEPVAVLRHQLYADLVNGVDLSRVTVPAATFAAAQLAFKQGHFDEDRGRQLLSDALLVLARVHEQPVMEAFAEVRFYDVDGDGRYRLRPNSGDAESETGSSDAPAQDRVLLQQGVGRWVGFATTDVHSGSAEDDLRALLTKPATDGGRRSRRLQTSMSSSSTNSAKRPQTPSSCRVSTLLRGRPSARTGRRPRCTLASAR